MSRFFSRFDIFPEEIPIGSMYDGMIIPWSNYSDFTRPGLPNGGLVREIHLFQGILDW